MPPIANPDHDNDHDHDHDHAGHEHGAAQSSFADEPLTGAVNTRIRIEQMDCPTEERLIRDALGRRQSENGQKAADMIVLNAGAALYAADLASSLKQGVEMAHDALSTGLARDKLEELVSFTAVFKQENQK